MRIIILIFLSSLLINIFSEDDAEPFHFSTNVKRVGPQVDRERFLCYGYYVGEKQIGIEKYDPQSGKLVLQTLLTDGVRNGLGKSWYSSGKIKSMVNFTNGFLNGEWKEWAEDGFLEGNSRFSQGNGIRRIYYKNGNIKRSDDYKDNEICGFRKAYYENGKMRLLAKMTDSHQDGETFGFKPDGSIDSYSVFNRLGQLNGYVVTKENPKPPVLCWYVDGQLLWDSNSGDPPPESIKNVELDPVKVYNSIVIPSDYNKKP